MLTRIAKLATISATCALAAVVDGGPATAAPEDPGISINAQLDRSILKAGETQKVHVRIAIQSRRPTAKSRPPLNLALVIDRSGSMAGPRIEAARRAALDAVDRLGRDDILSVVSYDDRVEVEVPATKLTNPAQAREAIRKLGPRGSTAIYAGLQAGAEEVRKFKSKDRVSKIILLSDGLANVGPSKPADFAGLGRELASEGMTISTVGLGLGYNEDLMAALAKSGDGSHAFIQEPAELAQFLARELDDTLGIVAQDVEIIITCLPGVRPLRSLGREGDIKDGRMAFKVSQIVGGVDQVIVAELEVPAGLARDAADLAKVEIVWSPAGETGRKSKATQVAARFDEVAKSDASIDPEVVKDVTALVVRAERQEAIKLRDEGRVEEATKKFEANAAYVRQQQSLMPSLKAYEPLQSELYANDAAAAPAASTASGWAKARKVGREADGNKAGGSVRY